MYMFIGLDLATTLFLKMLIFGSNIGDSTEHVSFGSNIGGFKITRRRFHWIKVGAQMPACSVGSAELPKLIHTTHNSSAVFDHDSR